MLRELVLGFGFLDCLWGLPLPCWREDLWKECYPIRDR